MPFTSETARKAGQKSKPGQHKRTREWEQLGEFITKAGAKKAMRILNSMPDDDYLDQYQKLLSYFKPKLQSTQVKSESDITITITEPPDEG